MFRNIYVLHIALLFLVMMIVEKSNAVPSFSRKYQTSCQTCHDAFPRLNEFGEGFRLNGYQFPRGKDEEYIKEEPVRLGARAYEDLWPDAVWPGEIPGTSPVSVVPRGNIMYDPDDERRWRFDTLLDEIAVIGAGTIGKDIGFMAEVKIDTAGVEPGRLFFTVHNIAGPYGALNVRVGKFEPIVLSVSNHRTLVPDYWILTRMVGDNEWSLEPDQLGIEMRGMLFRERFFYSAGIFEGRGNHPTRKKDLYAHIRYKFGGLRLDGAAGAKGNERGSSHPGFSLQTGLFVYRGWANIDENQEDSYYMFGGDMSAWYHRLRATLGIAKQKHSQPFQLMKHRDASVFHAFFETSYEWYPWFIPIIRYELMNQVDNGTDQRLVGGVSVLMRPNIKFNVEADLLLTGESVQIPELRSVAVGFMFGI